MIFTVSTAIIGRSTTLAMPSIITDTAIKSHDPQGTFDTAPDITNSELVFEWDSNGLSGMQRTN
jgi:hypothetical protein